MIPKEKIFPTLIIVLCVIAGVIFLTKGDMRKGFFWIFVGAANFCATF